MIINMVSGGSGGDSSKPLLYSSESGTGGITNVLASSYDMWNYNTSTQSKSMSVKYVYTYIKNFDETVSSNYTLLEESLPGKQIFCGNWEYKYTDDDGYNLGLFNAIQPYTLGDLQTQITIPGTKYYEDYYRNMPFKQYGYKIYISWAQNTQSVRACTTMNDSTNNATSYVCNFEDSTRCQHWSASCVVQKNSDYYFFDGVQLLFDIEYNQGILSITGVRRGDTLEKINRSLLNSSNTYKYSASGNGNFMQFSMIPGLTIVKKLD